MAIVTIKAIQVFYFLRMIQQPFITTKTPAYGIERSNQAFDKIKLYVPSLRSISRTIIRPQWTTYVKPRRLVQTEL